MKPFARFWIPACLTIWLASCGQTVKTETIRLTPPTSLTLPCKVADPKPDSPTVRDLIASRALYRQALQDCDARMSAIREWAETPPQG